jgi:hypothetical protein
MDVQDGQDNSGKWLADFGASLSLKSIAISVLYRCTAALSIVAIPLPSQRGQEIAWKFVKIFDDT